MLRMDCGDPPGQRKCGGDAGAEEEQKHGWADGKKGEWQQQPWITNSREVGAEKTREESKEALTRGDLVLITCQ
jgi:hypothetical protein